jgi:arsenate reductase
MAKKSVTIYHNPRCTKSRQTLELLRERGVEPVVVEYLKSPPTVDELRSILRQLNVPAEEMVRTADCKKLGIPPATDDGTILEQISQHPEILQRPIVIANGQARLGRPPENVLEIL